MLQPCQKILERSFVGELILSWLKIFLIFSDSEKNLITFLCSWKWKQLEKTLGKRRKNRDDTDWPSKCFWCKKSLFTIGKVRLSLRKTIYVRDIKKFYIWLFQCLNWCFITRASQVIFWVCFSLIYF